MIYGTRKRPDVMATSKPYTPPARIWRALTFADLLDAAGIEGGGAADEPVHLVALLEEEFGEVGAVLAGDAGDEGFLLLGGCGRHGRGDYGDEVRSRS